MTSREKAISLAICLAVGIAVACGGGALAGDNLGLFGEPNGPLLGLGIVLLLLGLAATAVAVVGLLALAVRALLRAGREAGST
jgi:hypothetical protein